MRENNIKMTLILSAAVLIILYLLLLRPDYLASSSGLAKFVGAEIVLLAIAKYSKLFFPILMLTFMAAGSDVPKEAAFVQARWIVLGIGAVVGIAVYMKRRNHHFSAFHLIALFCMLSAVISASVSEYASEAGLKAASLVLLFIYAGSGARLASCFDTERFFRGLLIACEVLTWFCAASYLALRWQFFGNPNSLGAITGVVLVPVLLWGLLTSESRPRRLRFLLELSLAGLLLLSSFSRAGISAALVSSFLACMALRRYRLMIKGAAAALAIAVCAISLVPHASTPEINRSESLQEAYLYKGQQEEGLLGSRRQVWQETWKSIKENPWFGTGFGTSRITGDMTALQYAAHHIDSWVLREHGNSYLAIAEWTGLLGVLPFYALIAMAAVNAAKVFAWLRRTRAVFSPAVPAAMILTGGLIDAVFEDWMFAVGYYLAVFFWVMAFILVDIAPWRDAVLEPVPFAPAPEADYLPMASGQ